MCLLCLCLYTEKECRNCSYRFFCWFFSLLVWVFLILFIYEYVKSSYLIFICPLVVCYMMYLALEFSCSPISSYLCNKGTDKGIYEYMGKLYMTPPTIKLYCECYHYRNKNYNKRDKNGNIPNRSGEIIITNKKTSVVPYYSERDVSGLFYLNCDEAAIKRKTYIKLDLFGEVNFADPISYMDYISYKDEFWRKNRFRDVYMKFNISRQIPGLARQNLIKFRKGHCCMNYFWFFICNILTVGEFYKIFFNSSCVCQSYKIRKVVSTRYDLNQPVYQEQYLQLVPQLNLITQQYTYEANYYNYLNPNKKVNVPTTEELRQAEQYKDKIPNYNVSSGNDKYPVGVIEDCVGFSNADYITPPPAFASIEGNVPIPLNQVNRAGNVPNGFGQNQNNITPNSNFVNPNQNINVNSNYVSMNQQNQIQDINQKNQIQEEEFSNSNTQALPSANAQIFNPNSDSRGLKSK